MSEEKAPSAAPGRPVRLIPALPGFWTTMLGVATAAIAPLFGFLIGSMVRTPGDTTLSPIYWGLFIGIVIGGAGVLAAVVGGLRLWRHLHGSKGGASS